MSINKEYCMYYGVCYGVGVVRVIIGGFLPPLYYISQAYIISYTHTYE